MTATDISTYRNILVLVEDAIAYVTMNRPERRNALSLEHMEELIACFKAIGRDRSVAVAVLAGHGPAFCAGHDLGEMVGRDAVFYRRVFDVCTELMETIQSIPQVGTGQSGVPSASPMVTKWVCPANRMSMPWTACQSWLKAGSRSR